MEDLSFAFHAEENPDTESRQATITLGGNGLAETVTVYQAGTAPVLVLGQQEYIVGSTGETLTVELQSNTDYRVQLPAVDWLTETDTRSLSAYTHYFAVAPNDTYDARTAEIIFTTADGTLADTVFVTQVQQDALIVAQQEYDIPAKGGTLDFTVQTNVDVIATPDVDWITQASDTRGLVEKNLCFDIAPNEGTEARQGTITLSGGGVDNLPLLYYATVYRDRYYSNGEVITDTFVDTGHMVSLVPTFIPAESGSRSFPNEHIMSWNGITTKIDNDSVDIEVTSTQVTDLTKISTQVGQNEYFSTAGEWDRYSISKLYNSTEFISATDVPSQGNWDICDLEVGWYFRDIRSIRVIELGYDDGFGMLYGIRLYSICLAVYDQYLSIDGRRIDFLKYQPEYHFNLQTKDIPNGIEHTYECSFEFMGRNFYTALINTITQL